MAVGSLTDYMEIAILNGLHRSAAMPRSANLYVALFSSDPTDTGAAGTEITTGGMTRRVIAAADASWTAPALVGTSYQITNAVEAVFPAPTAAYTPTHWGLFDAVLGGNLWIAGALDGTPRSVDAGDDALRFAIDSLAISLAGDLSPYLEAALLNQLFRTTVLTKPGNHYLALYNGDPTGVGVELSGSGYARVAIAVADASWAAPVADGTDKSITNLLSLSWATIGAAWGTYTYLGIRDAASAGNLWWSMPVAVSRTINLGDNPPSAGVGALKLQFG